MPFDGWGFVTLSAALVSLLVALSQVQQEGWDSTFILSLLAICGVAACLFLFIEGRIAIPLLDLSLYRRLLYTSGTCAAVILGVFFYSSSFLTVLFMAAWPGLFRAAVGPGADPGRRGHDHLCADRRLAGRPHRPAYSHDDRGGGVRGLLLPHVDRGRGASRSAISPGPTFGAALAWGS